MMPRIKLFTIGFTKKTAQEFFSKLQQAGVGRRRALRWPFRDGRRKGAGDQDFP
jgi:hypothetical protein